MPAIRVVVLLVAVMACKKKAREVGIGEACTSILECADDASCFEGKCRARGQAGEPCVVPGDCAADMTCSGRACVSTARIAELAAEAQRKADAEKEARLLKEGGVVDTAIAEAPVPSATPGPGQRIRTVTLKSRQSVFAPCKADERLVGGGCRAEGWLLGNYPSHDGEQDTMGGRWNCETSEGNDVTAFALCQKP